MSKKNLPMFQLIYTGPKGEGVTKVFRPAFRGTDKDSIRKIQIPGTGSISGDNGRFKIEMPGCGCSGLIERDIKGLVDLCLSMIVELEREKAEPPKAPRFYPPFRVGASQKRSVLDKNGHKVVIFPVGNENLAKSYVDQLNEKGEPLC